MRQDFHQIEWGERLENDLETLVQLAVYEDLGQEGDWTSRATVPEAAQGQAAIVARQPGVVAGLRGIATICRQINSEIHWTPNCSDGESVAVGQSVGVLRGPARAMLAAERIVLNLIGRLSGIATLTQRYVDAIAGTSAAIYDTRKTTPGWRRLEKYAVRCGGGRNHRGGLNEAVLIKDNHLALGASAATTDKFTPAEAVLRAREFLGQHSPGTPMIVEVEVDTLDQLDQVLPSRPDIVLLDNMTCDQMRQAVARRNAYDRQIELEASGGVNLQTVAAIAQTGVERISVGALTHSAISLDFGLDWLGPEGD